MYCSKLVMVLQKLNLPFLNKKQLMGYTKKIFISSEVLSEYSIRFFFIALQKFEVV